MPPDDALPAHILAALHAPEGTTVEDIFRRFPHLRPAEPDADTNTNTNTDPDTDFAHRYDEAIHDWQSRNGWVEVPDGVAREIADQLRR